MIISPNLLRENMLSRLNSMLIKVKDKTVDLDSNVVLTSWNSFTALNEGGWKIPKKDGEYKITGAICTDYKKVSAVIQNSNKDVEMYLININTLNVEDLYKLYFEISNKITASVPAMIDLSEEMHKYDN